MTKLMLLQSLFRHSGDSDLARQRFTRAMQVSYKARQLWYPCVMGRW